MLTVFAGTCWSSTCSWLAKGRTEMMVIPRRSHRLRLALVVDVEGEPTGPARVNGEHLVVHKAQANKLA